MIAKQRLFEASIPMRRVLTGQHAPMVSPGHAAQFWHRADPNVGDLLAGPIVRTSLGIRTSWVARTFKGKLLGLGSIARHVQEGDLLVGCGSIENDEIRMPTNARVAWLRGPLTRRCFGEARLPEIYGDPGLLMSEVLPITPRRQPGRIGVVPHLVDAELRRSIAQRNDVMLIDVQSAPADFLEELCACEVVLSSSLHGIVLAESYGVPALWLSPHPNMKGGRHKFDDYYLGTGRATLDPLDLDAALEIARSGELRPADLDLADMHNEVSRVRLELNS